jgi:putative Ca2+/H+ antiporter (TMEM165/GDT1 family)
VRVAVMGALLLALGVVFVAELGDKTQLVVLTLGARQRIVAAVPALAVTIALLQGIAVSVGATLASVVPDRALEIGAGLLFCGFAVWTWRGANVDDREEEGAGGRSRGGVLGMCVAFFLAELGDKTQLTAAALAADHGAPAVWVGATAGLLGATLLALVAGRFLAERVAARTLGRIGAVAFAAVGVFTLTTAVV